MRDSGALFDAMDAARREVSKDLHKAMPDKVSVRIPVL